MTEFASRHRDASRNYEPPEANICVRCLLADGFDDISSVTSI
jgi:hypothetical protein